MNKPTAIAAALALAAVGALFYNALPIFLGLAQDSLALSSSQLGLLGSAFFVGYNLVTLSAFFWMRRVNWHVLMLVATPIVFLSLVGLALSSNYTEMMMAAVLAGAAFSALYGLSSTAISDTTQPTRWFGFKVAAEGFAGVLLFLILPGTLITSYGLVGLLIGMALMIAILSVAFFWLPAQGVSADIGAEIAVDQSPTTTRRENVPVWLCIFACFAFFTGQTTLWAFVERIGAASGFDATSIGHLISVTLMFAVSGSLIAGFSGDRFGNRWPFLVMCFLFLAALPLLNVSGHFMAYAIGACVVTLSFGGGIPFCLAETAALDPDGRYIVLTVPAIGLGAMLGPGIAGLLVDLAGQFALLTFGAAAVIISAVLFLLLGKKN